MNVFANYSYPGQPGGRRVRSEGEANFPANNRVNAGFNFSHARYLGNLSVSYTGTPTGRTCSTRALRARTDAFTLVNGGIGVRWAGGRW